MKLAVMSDIHIECRSRTIRDELPTPEADVAIIAGDLSNWAGNPHLKASTRVFFEHMCEKYPYVIIVTGNHDHFKVLPHELDSAIKFYKLKNLIHLKSGDEFELGGHRFMGDTMWYKDCEDPQEKRWFIDFERIPKFEPWVYEENSKFINLVAKRMKPGDVIISHHLPTNQSVDARYKNETTNVFFLCDVEDLILKNQPSLWIHGHTHSAFDYKIGNTRVYANPMGYNSEGVNPDFKNRMIVEI